MGYRPGIRLTGLLAMLLMLEGAPAQTPQPLEQRIDEVLALFERATIESPDNAQVQSVAQPRIELHDCADYPYASHGPDKANIQALLTDLSKGLRRGLQCLSGQGPAGKLHRYHYYQAHRLTEIWESTKTKSFVCVSDQMPATAIATRQQPPEPDDYLYRMLTKEPHPAVVLDTYRIGGLLSRNHSLKVYREFFKLDQEQIEEHLTGHPIRLEGMHRYQDLPALLFHEMVHWLGHTHSSIYPDLVHLYETCCFGGSDYINDARTNQNFQQQACAILKDRELWDDAYHPYKQAQLWHYKEYDQLKREMRLAYD